MRKTLLLLLISISLSAAAHASSFVERPLPEVIGETATVIRGRIGMHYTDWSTGADGSRKIFTYYQLDVGEVLKGQVSASSLVFREVGGEKDGVGLEVPGSAQFSQGEDVVVFLGLRNPEGSYDLRGLSTGKYILEKNEAGQEVLVGFGTGLGSTERGGIVHPDDGDGPKGNAEDSQWTLAKLRELIQDRRSAPPQRHDPSASPVSPVEASPLQTQASKEIAAPEPRVRRRWGLLAGIGVISVGLIGALRRMRGSNRPR